MPSLASIGRSAVGVREVIHQLTASSNFLPSLSAELDERGFSMEMEAIGVF